MQLENHHIEEVFKNLEGQFDIEVPTIGHKERFLDKLAQQNMVSLAPPKKKNYWWKAIAAASVLLISFSVFIYSNNSGTQEDLASVSPEAAQSQVYFVSLIENELDKIKALENEDTKQIIGDVLAQMERLEKDYESLKQKMLENGEDKRILHAMINNFQLRINLLENVLSQIDEIKLLKNEDTIL